MKTALTHTLIVSLLWLTILLNGCGGSSSSSSFTPSDLTNTKTEKIVMSREITSGQNTYNQLLVVDPDGNNEQVLQNDDQLDHYLLYVTSNNYLVYAVLHEWLETPGGAPCTRADPPWGYSSCFPVIDIYSIKVSDIGSANASPIPISVGEEQVVFHTVSGDDRIIYSFVENPFPEPKIKSVGPDGNNPEFISSNPGQPQTFIAVSNDNTVVFSVSFNSGPPLFYGAPADGLGNDVRLSSTTDHRYFGISRYDTIAMMGYDGTSWKIFSVDANGSNSVELTTLEAIISVPNTQNDYLTCVNDAVRPSTCEYFEFNGEAASGRLIFSVYKRVYANLEADDTSSVKIYIINNDNSDIVELAANTGTGAYYQGLTNDNKVVFTDSDYVIGANVTLYIIDADGSNLLALETGESTGYLGATSENRLFIASRDAFGDQTTAYYAVDADNSNRVLLTNQAAYPYQITFNNKLLYDFNDSGTLYLSIADGTKDIRLTDKAFHYFRLATLDNKIIFGRPSVNGGDGYFIINDDGSNLISLDPNADDRIPVAVVYNDKPVYICGRSAEPIPQNQSSQCSY